MTQKVRAIRIKAEVPGSNEEIVLVDTPGFGDTDKVNFQTLEMIAAWLKDAYELDLISEKMSDLRP